MSEVASHAPSRKYSSLVVPPVFSGEVATSMFLFNRDAFNLCRGEGKEEKGLEAGWGVPSRDSPDEEANAAKKNMNRSKSAKRHGTGGP